MSGFLGGLSEVAEQGLAIIGAIVLLLTFFVGGVVTRTTIMAGNSTGTKQLKQELNGQFLLFSLLLLLSIVLAMNGITLALILAIAFGLLLASYRWLWEVNLVVMGAISLLIIFSLIVR